MNSYFAAKVQKIPDIHKFFSSFHKKVHFSCVCPDFLVPLHSEFKINNTMARGSNARLHPATPHVWFRNGNPQTALPPRTVQNRVGEAIVVVYLKRGVLTTAARLLVPPTLNSSNLSKTPIFPCKNNKKTCKTKKFCTFLSIYLYIWIFFCTFAAQIIVRTHIQHVHT